MRNPFTNLLAARVTLVVLGTTVVLKGAVPKAQFEVEGGLSYKVWIGQKAVIDERRDFSIAVDGCKWLIRIWDSTGTSTNGILYSEAGCDSTNIYRVTAFDTNVLASGSLLAHRTGDGFTNAVNSRLTSLRNNAVAGVLPGSFPLPTRIDMFVIPVWLGYASGCYFGEAHDGLLRPVYIIDPSLNLKTYLVKADWRTLDEGTGVPSWVVYFNDGRTFKRPGMPLGLADPPYDQGFTNAIYEVTSSTNVGGLVVPSSFHLITFVPKRGGQSPSELVATTEFAAVAKQARRGPGIDSFVPELPAKAFVTDARVQSVTGKNGYVYFASNGVWLPKASVEKLAARTQAPRHASRAVLGVLVLVTVAFIILMVKHYGKGLGSSPRHKGWG